MNTAAHSFPMWSAWARPTCPLCWPSNLTAVTSSSRRRICWTRHKPGSWPNVFRDFRVAATDFESIGKLESPAGARPLRSTPTSSLTSRTASAPRTRRATKCSPRSAGASASSWFPPRRLNNTPQDILSQIKLFQPGKNSTIPNVRNLEAFFAGLRREAEGTRSAARPRTLLPHGSGKRHSRPARRSSSS